LNATNKFNPLKGLRGLPFSVRKKEERRKEKKRKENG
jgi:hypothetical protein